MFTRSLLHTHATSQGTLAGEAVYGPLLLYSLIDFNIKALIALSTKPLNLAVISTLSVEESENVRH